jgi:hypothetical protein
LVDFGAAVLAPFRDEIPVELDPGGIALEVHGHVLDRELPLGEEAAHHALVDVGLDRLPAVLVTSGMDEGDVGRRRPHLGGERRIGGVHTLGVGRHQAPDLGLAVGRGRGQDEEKGAGGYH